jgi:hypothetical protein
MPVCPKCHKMKKKSVFNRHKSSCIACPRDLGFYNISRSGKHPETCECERCKKKRQRKL